MPLFRKKPIDVEACQFIDPRKDANAAAGILILVEWCGGQFTHDAIGPCILIDTLEGQMRADPGDWIICGVKGEFYPCKDEIFQATYEVSE